MSDVLGHSQRPVAAAALVDKPAPAGAEKLALCGTSSPRATRRRGVMPSDPWHNELAQLLDHRAARSHFTGLQPEAVTEVILQALKGCS